MLDPLEVGEAAGRKGELPVAADAAVECRVGAERPQLPAKRGGQRGQITAGVPPAPWRDPGPRAAGHGAAEGAHTAADAPGEEPGGPRPRPRPPGGRRAP